MIQLTDYESISTLISKQLKPGVLTNNFITEKTYKNEIKNGTIYYYLWDGGLLFFRKREDFWKLNYYITDIEKTIDFEIPKTTVMETVCRPVDKSNAKAVEYWLNKGFSIYLERVRMQKNINDFQKIDFEKQNNTQIIYAKIDEVEEIDNILKYNFDKYSGCLLNTEELKDEIKNLNIYCAKDENNKIVGVLHRSKSGNVSEIRHLAVSKEYRGKGIASALVELYINDSKCNKNVLWVSKDNEVAKQFYLKNGYEFDGWTSTVLIYKQK